MVENIALLKEVQEFMPTKEAQEEGLALLSKLKLSHIGMQRVAQCKSVELFYVMFIRAMMSKKSHIIIDMPYTIIHNLQEIEKVISNIEILNDSKKNIFILDTLNHKIRYKSYNNLEITSNNSSSSIGLDT